MSPERARGGRQWQALLIITLFWSLKVADLARAMARPSAGVAQVAFAYLTRTSDAVYFPTLPLAHLLAEGELYHLAAAVHDRERLAGFTVGPQLMAQHTPREAPIVCWEDSWGADYVRTTYFVDYDIETTISELPQFQCYRRRATDPLAPEVYD